MMRDFQVQICKCDNGAVNTSLSVASLEYVSQVENIANKVGCVRFLEFGNLAV